MISVADKSSVCKSFSKASVHYDFLTCLHKEISKKLVSKIVVNKRDSRILDVGMGTGWFTSQLKSNYPNAKVFGIDFASGMIDIAKRKNRNLKIIQADANALPFKRNSFDLITSNLAYQWVEDLHLAFKHCNECLKKNGKIHFAIFGYKTLDELFASLKFAANKGKKYGRFAFGRLAKKEQVSAALKKSGFKNIKIHSELLTANFSDMFDLIKWTKGIGANVVRKNAYVGKNLLNTANDYYIKKFGNRIGVSSTFEVIWVEGRK